VLKLLKTIAIPFLCLTVLHVLSPPAKAKEQIQCDNSDAERMSFFIRPLPDVDPIPVTIPSAYFDKQFDPIRMSVQDSALLDADVNGFEPWQGGDQADHIGILVSEFIDLTELANMRAKIQAGVPLDTAQTFAEIEIEHDLRQLEIARKETGFLPTDIYFGSLESTPQTTDLITCDSAGSTPIAMCTHYIDVPLADIKLNYQRVHLSNWAGLSAQARMFWACATKFPTLQK